LALTKKWFDSISAPLTLLTSQTFMQCLLSTCMWFIWLHVLLSGDVQLTLRMSWYWYHVPVADNFFSVQNLPFIFHCHWFCCESCALHLLDINMTVFQL
jgi:hypothetical protein